MKNRYDIYHNFEFWIPKFKNMYPEWSPQQIVVNVAAKWPVCHTYITHSTHIEEKTDKTVPYFLSKRKIKTEKKIGIWSDNLGYRLVYQLLCLIFYTV